MDKNEISVLMVIDTAKLPIKETIESILNQSFDKFDFIIVNNHSSDTTQKIINLYSDHRIILIENKHGFVESVNAGLSIAKGKYIAFMDYESIMHIDRLRIEHAIMKESPEITVCSSTMKMFGLNTTISETKADFGLIKLPLLKFIEHNFIFNSTTMIRTDFIRKNNIMFEDYSSASDYKFYVEVAKAGGIFYVESQPLVYYRLKKEQTLPQYKQEEQTTILKIQNDIVQYLVSSLETTYPELNNMLGQFVSLREKGFITNQYINNFYQYIFTKNQRIIEKYYNKS